MANKIQAMPVVDALKLFLPSPASMTRGPSGNIIPMTVDELRTQLPDLRHKGDSKSGVPHGHGEIMHPAGITWSGVFVDGTLPNGVMTVGPMRYEGELLNLWPHGQGTRKGTEGSVCSGRFAYGQLIDGHSVVPGKGTYEGSYRDSVPHGRGTWVLHDGPGCSVTQEGVFEKGHLTSGRIVQPDGSYSEGSFCAGALHGRGRKVCTDGSEYEGDFKHGKRHGHGLFTNPATGYLVEGEWRDGVCVYGKLLLNGSEYEGQMAASGLPHGSGRLSADDGVLEASFDGFAVSGQCRMSHESGYADVFVRTSGDVELRTLRHDGYELTPSLGDAGIATVKLPNGVVYAGAVRHGQAHGVGELSIPAIGTCKGMFDTGRLEGMATVSLASGSILTCAFRAGLPNGPGHYVSGKGEVFTGHFEDGLMCGPGAVLLPGNGSISFSQLGAGETPCRLASGEQEILFLGEALVGLCVAFPFKVIVKGSHVKGKGLFIQTFGWDVLPDGEEPFSVELVPGVEFLDGPQITGANKAGAALAA